MCLQVEQQLWASGPQFNFEQFQLTPRGSVDAGGDLIRAVLRDNQGTRWGDWVGRRWP